MNTPHFVTPESIKGYGKKLDQFNDAMKLVASHLRALGYPNAAVETLVGHSPYNSLYAKTYPDVVYGPEDYQHAVKKSHAGLFGIFFILHLPEMQMAKHMPGILGKEFGFKLRIERDEKVFTAPLPNAESLSFTERATGDSGSIVAKKSISLRSSDGEELVLDVGDTVLKGSVDSPKKSDCLIIDSQGKRLSPRASAVVLWGSQGAKAMKSLTSERRNTLQNSGTDDDFAAEHYMIEAMTDLYREHGVDLMPYFNKYVELARHQLQSNPEYLAAWSIAKNIGDLDIVYRASVSPRKHKLGSMKHEFGESANYFGISLPTFSKLQDPSHPQYRIWKDFSDYVHDAECPAAKAPACEHAIYGMPSGYGMLPPEYLKTGHGPARERMLNEGIALVAELTQMVNEKSAMIGDKKYARTIRSTNMKLQQNLPDNYVSVETFTPFSQQILDKMKDWLNKVEASSKTRTDKKSLRDQCRQEAIGNANQPSEGTEVVSESLSGALPLLTIETTRANRSRLLASASQSTLAATLR